MQGRVPTSLAAPRIMSDRVERDASFQFRQKEISRAIWGSTFPLYFLVLVLNKERSTSQPNVAVCDGRGGERERERESLSLGTDDDVEMGGEGCIKGLGLDNHS